MHNGEVEPCDSESSVHRYLRESAGMKLGRAVHAMFFVSGVGALVVGAFMAVPRRG